MPIRLQTLDVDKKQLEGVLKTFDQINFDELNLLMMNNESSNEEYIKLVASGLANKYWHEPHSNAIVVRNISMMFDFMYEDETRARDNQGRIHYREQEYSHNKYTDIDYPQSQTVYRTNKEKTKMDQKCILLTGCKYPSDTQIDELQLWRSAVKLVDRHILLHDKTQYMFRTPLLFGITKDRDLDLEIKVTLTERIKSFRDQLIMTGYVAELIGVNVQG